MSSLTTSNTVTVSPGTSGDSDLALLRRIVDQLDARVIGALHARRNTSQRIQASKIDSGLSRVDLVRERQIIATYRDELGPLGVAIAEAILNYSKGNPV